MKLSLCNFSTIALGQEYKCFFYWTRNKRSLLLFSFFTIVVAFCSVSLKCPPAILWMTWFYSNIPQNKSKIYSRLQTYFFLAHVGPYWNAMWFLLNLLPTSDWLHFQQGFNCASLLAAKLCFTFQYLIFCINSLNFCVTK